MYVIMASEAREWCGRMREGVGWGGGVKEGVGWGGGVKEGVEECVNYEIMRKSNKEGAGGLTKA